MSKTTAAKLVLLLAILLLLPTIHSSVPSLINYQGLAKDSGGVPLNGSFPMTFRIWSGTSGGSQLWSETHPTVAVNQGLFKVVLGSQGAGLPQSVFSGSEAWLEIVVNGETIAPRNQFTTNAFSHRVSTVDGASSGSLNGNLTVTGKVTATSAIEPLGGIITPGGITIQSSGSNVVIVAGTSTITISPGGGITIQGSSVGINSTGVLTLSATNKIALDAPWVDVRSDSLVAVSDLQTRVIAGSNLNLSASAQGNLNVGGVLNVSSGGNGTITSSSTLDLNGSVITIN